MARPRPSRAPSLSNLFGGAGHHHPSSAATSISSTTNSAGLPLPPVPSQRDHQNAPGPKRSIKNLFSTKKQQHQKQKDGLELDFGCLGLRDEEDELCLDEVDLLLERDEELHITAVAVEHELRINAVPSSTSTPIVAGRQRSGSRNAMDHKFGSYGRSHQYAAPMQQHSQQISSARMTKSNSDIIDDGNLSTSSPSLTHSDTSTFFSGPSSSRSSASFSSFASVPSPTKHSFISCSSASNTPLTSTFSHDAHDSGASAQTTSTIPPAWHPDETEEEAVFRRAQEEQAAIEALEAYFAIQSAKKSENMVDQRRDSSPSISHSQQSSTTSTVVPLIGQRRGSAPTVLRTKRSEGSLQTATRFRDSVAVSRRPHFGRNRSNTTGTPPFPPAIKRTASNSNTDYPSSPLPSVPPSPSMGSFIDMNRSPSSPSFPTTQSVASSRRGSIAKPTYEYI